MSDGKNGSCWQNYIVFYIFIYELVLQKFDIIIIMINYLYCGYWTSKRKYSQNSCIHVYWSVPNRMIVFDLPSTRIGCLWALFDLERITRHFYFFCLYLFWEIRIVQATFTINLSYKFKFSEDDGIFEWSYKQRLIEN